MHSSEILVAALDDSLSFRVLRISIASFILTLSILLSFAYYFFENFHSTFSYFGEVVHASAGVILDKINSIPLVGILLEHEILYLFFKYVIMFSVGIGIYYLFFIIYGIVLGFFTGNLVRYVQKKHYSNVIFKGMHIINTVIFYVKTTMLTLFIFVILLPLYVLPVTNFTLLLSPYYFFHKTIIYDVASVINDMQEYQKIIKVNSMELKGITGLCFALSLIPVIGIFLYPLYIILISHYILKETEELRHLQNFHS